MAVYTTVDKSTDYFETKLYTGNGGTQSITGLDFSPSWVWIKRRNGLNEHALFDTPRGATKMIATSTDEAEQTFTNQLTSFNSDGFSLGNYSSVNGSSYSQVSWNWKGGTTSGIATNADTTITPSAYSFDQTSGFSTIKYSGNGVDGAYLPHGLGVSPQVMIVKRLTDHGHNWYMYHVALGNQKYMTLNTTAAISGTDGMWYSYTPTSVNMRMSNDAQIGVSGKDYVMYCFAEKQGFSKMGSYLGNASTDGAFIFTGFKPAWVLIKNTAATEAWFLYDNKRGVNGSMAALFPDENAADASADNIDLLSNGFKLRTAGAILNSAATFVYMAFAENPFVTSTGIPTPAR